jgi:serine phosphatase RsbU (regulator of sigma subunit)
MPKTKGIIAKKIQIRLFVVVFLLLALVYGYFLYTDQQLIPVYYLPVFGAFVLIVALYIYQTQFASPVKKILIQIKSLLTGRKYKKIYSNRTDEIGVIAHFFNEVTGSFEKVSEQLKEGKLITGELETAGQLQKELMPMSTPSIKGFDIAIKNRSAEELGGDNIDFIKAKNSLYCYVGDVTGHGVPAAIIMTMVNTLINAYAEIYDSAYDIVVHTNRRLKSKIRSTMFMSMLMLKWDEFNKKMSYVGCGHEYLIVYRAKTGKCDVMKSGGIALGMVPDNSKIVKEIEVVLHKDDVVVLYTDGVTEAKNMKGEMFGLERLVAATEQYGSEVEANSIVQNIAKEFSSFVEDHVQEDDITLIVMKAIEQNKEGKTYFDQQQSRWNEDSFAKAKQNSDEQAGIKTENVETLPQNVNIGDIKTNLIK